MSTDFDRKIRWEQTKEFLWGLLTFALNIGIGTIPFWVWYFILPYETAKEISTACFMVMGVLSPVILAWIKWDESRKQKRELK